MVSYTPQPGGDGWTGASEQGLLSKRKAEPLSSGFHTVAETDADYLCFSHVPNPVPIIGVKGERSILIGQTEDRYLPVLGEVRAWHLNRVMEKRVALFLGEVGG